MDEYEAGRKAGEDAAREAWSALDWRISCPLLPVRHGDRKLWLAGFALGLAEYNATVTTD
jgi:hypothetical protein